MTFIFGTWGLHFVPKHSLVSVLAGLQYDWNLPTLLQLRDLIEVPVPQSTAHALHSDQSEHFASFRHISSRICPVEYFKSNKVHSISTSSSLSECAAWRSSPTWPPSALRSFRSATARSRSEITWKISTDVLTGYFEDEDPKKNILLKIQRMIVH